jgi:hypothetical protein
MRFRNAVLLYAPFVLFWLQLEDNHVLPVVLLGTVGAGLLTIYWLRGRVDLRQAGLRGWLAAALGGMIWGMAAAVVTALLMVLKAGMHGHVFPDYPPGQVLAVLALAPTWAVAGALLVVGGVAVWRALKGSA